jgi:hypothetical protein
MSHEVVPNQVVAARPARRRSPFWLRLGVALAAVAGALARGVDRVREAAARQS